MKHETANLLIKALQKGIFAVESSDLRTNPYKADTSSTDVYSLGLVLPNNVEVNIRYRVKVKVSMFKKIRTVSVKAVYANLEDVSDPRQDYCSISDDDLSSQQIKDLGAESIRIALEVLYKRSSTAKMHRLLENML